MPARASGSVWGLAVISLMGAGARLRIVAEEEF